MFVNFFVDLLSLLSWKNWMFFRDVFEFVAYVEL